MARSGSFRKSKKTTTTSTPATSVSRALQDTVVASDHGQLLTRGIHVEKITTRGKLYPRVLTLSSDGLALFCTHAAISSGNGDNAVPSSLALRLPLPLISRKGIPGLTSNVRERYVRYMDVADMDAVCAGAVVSRKSEQCKAIVNTKQQQRSSSNSQSSKKQQLLVTILHHGDQTLDVVVKTLAEQTALVSCLRQAMATFRAITQSCGPEALLLRYIWYDVDANRDGTISESEFLKILSRINLCIASPKRVFREYCRKQPGTKKTLQLGQVMGLLQATKRSEGNAALMLWKSLFGANTVTVDARALHTQFLQQAQGESQATLEDAQALLRRIQGMDIASSKDTTTTTVDDTNSGITFEQLEAYLYHDANAAYSPAARQLPTQPLDESLSKYFINTSHNTYLTGDQLQSASSVEMYDRALRRGCKCLELDCWDGDTKKRALPPEPVVFHGHTLTSKILFRDILVVVNQYLQEFPDTYPIILSLENHCSFPFQESMAKLLTETFGDKLYIPPKELEEPEALLPSPESLRGQVLIKGKRPPEPDDADEDGADDDFDPYTAGGDDNTNTISKSRSNGSSKAASVGSKPPVVVKALARLTLFHGTKYKAFDQSLNAPATHMHSINEMKIFKILSKKTNASMWRLYNVDHMTRTYPAGTRVDSSNYVPLVAWSMGCQMVALNFQTNDVPLILNDGFFRQQGGCGYVAKPTSVLEGGSGSHRPVLQLNVRMLSGTCLPKPRGAKSGEYIDPYVQVSVHDVKGNQAVQSSFSTGVVTDNGFCPVWTNQGDHNKSSTFEFVVYNPDLAIVRFGLRESDITLDEDVAYAAIPLTHLRTGYRSVQLYDRNNTRTGPFRSAALLMEVHMSKTITASFSTDSKYQDVSTSSRHA